jgi:hypothetical protein
MIRLKILSIFLLSALILTACNGELIPLPQPTAIIIHPEGAAAATPKIIALPTGTPSSTLSKGVMPSPTPLNIPPASTDMLPKPADQILSLGVAEFKSAEIIQLQTNPPKYVVHIIGSTPTPCHKLRVSVTLSKSDNRVVMKTYSVFDPRVICLQVIQPFNVTVPLNNLPINDYTVWLNDQLVGEIRASG